jgi:hypothetical protein
MHKDTGFKLTRKVVAVPAEFVFLNATRMSWASFNAALEVMAALEAIATKKWPGGIERSELRHLLHAAYDSDWVRLWSARGVIVSYNHFWEDDYGTRHTTEMVKAGPAYQPFMKAVRAFQAQLKIEHAKDSLESRRRDLQSQLQDLDRPTKKRPARLQDPLCDPLFATR